MVAEWIALTAVLLAVASEMIHLRRTRTLAILAFGPDRKPRFWARCSPWLRVAAVGLLTWGLVTLLIIKPKVHHAATLPEGEHKHIIIVLDVSPSMQLDDAGPSSAQRRAERAANLMESFFERVPMELYRVSVVAFYTGAKQVVVDTRDLEVVRNVLSDLPMHHAFQSGDTDLFAGLEEAAIIAKPWNPRSTTVVILSDGDTVPSQGMPKMPAAVSDVLVVGVGDPRQGKFINGRQSRQDASTLRQVAHRLAGYYHDGNEKQISSEMLHLLTQATQASPLERLTRREYALIACGLGATILAFLPPLLHAFGTAWRPGVVSGWGEEGFRLNQSIQPRYHGAVGGRPDSPGWDSAVPQGSTRR